RTASSAQRIRRTVARQSENVGSDFLYQAAPSTDSFPVFAASSEAHRVTSENSPNKSGVVRWIAKSDLTARFESYGAGSRLRFGGARRWSMRRIAARVTIASATSGSASYSLDSRRHRPSQPSDLSTTHR